VVIDYSQSMNEIARQLTDIANSLRKLTADPSVPVSLDTETLDALSDLMDGWRRIK